MGTRLLHRYAKDAKVDVADVHPWLVAALLETRDPHPLAKAKPARPKAKKRFWFWKWIAPRDPTPKPWWPTARPKRRPPNGQVI